MIAIDSSAVVAILKDEPEAQLLLNAIEAADRCLVSAVTVYEASIVMNRHSGPAGVSDVLDLLESIRAEIRPFTRDMIAIAVAAYQEHGKGTGAKAQLNFGDCISYALAKSLDVPLLFKGNDFAETDIRRCM